MDVKKINKKIATITLILILTMTVSIATIPAGAQSLEEIPTYLLLSVAPSPVGQGQPVYVNVFLSKPPLTAGLGGSGDMYENITVEMLRPDGNTEVFGPYRSDSTGGAWFSWTPDQVGEYVFQAFYPGQTLTGEGVEVFMEGGSTGEEGAGIEVLPSVSDEVTLVVQEDPVPAKYVSPSLPDEYWSRPIYSTNYQWAQLGGSWFGLRSPSFATTGMYDATGNFNPYTTAPNTAHIVWTKPTHFGGQVGLPVEADQTSQYMSTSIATNYFEPIILNGILYYTHYAGPTALKSSWEAVDIRTGETLWSRSAGETGDEVIRMGQILRYHSIQEYGAWAFLYACESAGFFSTPTFFAIYDAMTGEFVANITGIQNPPFLMDFEGEQQGTLMGYYTSGGNLTLWNSTKLMMSKSWDQITIRPSGTYEWDSGIEWSVPVPTQLNGVNISLGIGARTPEVILLRSAPSPGMFVELNYGYQITAGVDARTGEILWGPINQTLPALQDISLLAARDGVYILHNKDTNEAYGYSLEDGDKLWGPVALTGNAWSHIARGADIAYGNVYIWDFGGYVNSLDIETGELQWTYTRGSAGYDTPYGIYELWHFGTHSIADGKLFLSEGSMYNPPLHPSEKLAIDCETGELVWSILSYTGRCPAAHADGYMIQWNCFDSQIYSFGKGPTCTTITASPKVSVHGSSVLLEGTVMDISSGAEQAGVVERFPNGLPAVSDDSMTSWMEYVYMQQARPADVTGVTVKLEAIDPNGNYQNLGTTTSDSYGNYGFAFVPDVEGTYMVIATFDGSESFYSSTETAYITVDPAPAAATPIEPDEAPDTETPDAETPDTETPDTEAAVEAPLISTEVAIIAAVAVVCIIGVAAFWALRKRK